MQCLQAAKHCIWGPPDIISISVSVSILKWSANNGLADEVLLTWNQLPGSSWQHSSAQLVPADTTKAYESVHDGKRCLQGLRCRSESQASASRRVRAGPGEHLGSVAVSAPFHASADLSWSVNARRSGNGSLRGFNSVVGSRCSMTCRSTRLNTKRAPRSPEGIRPASRCPINVERDSAESASEVCREHIGMPPLRRLEALESDTQ